MQNDKPKYRKRTMRTEEIIKLYEEGRSTTEIGVLANVSSRYIRMLLTDNGVEKRSHGSWKRRYTLNEDYFKTWSNNMAYILGFFAADGMVARDAQLISISQKEKYILEDIRHELGSNHPLYKNKLTNVYTLNLNSKIMKADMIDIHGIMPNKSLKIKFPNVPEKYISHFVRGYFDGDGFVTYKKYFVSIVGGSESFMISLRNKIERAGFETNFTSHGTHFRVYVSGRKTIKLFSNWMYQDKELFLIRKYNIFQQEKLPIERIKDREYKTHRNAIEERKRCKLNNS